MFKILTAILYAIEILTDHCKCLNLIDLPQNSEIYKPSQPRLSIDAGEMYEPREYPPVRNSRTDSNKDNNRRYWLLKDTPSEQIQLKASNVYEDEKDTNLKSKISTLVQQTMHDTERKMKLVQQLKEKHREESPYRAGFVLSLIKKSRDVLNELFNVAIKHRDEWKALEQLKIFELLVHTNVDSTNLLRQLVDIHLNYLNATNASSENDKKKVILL